RISARPSSRCRIFWQSPAIAGSRPSSKPSNAGRPRTSSPIRRSSALVRSPSAAAVTIMRWIRASCGESFCMAFPIWLELTCSLLPVHHGLKPPAAHCPGIRNMTPQLAPELIAAAAECRAWPFEEARKIVARYEKKGVPKRVLFETGYGPSGLPHIGTFGEVARTTMVRHAFHVLTKGQVKTTLLCFSDDMDGMRKVPDNVPNREMLAEHLGKPLTRVPDPFGEYESFGHHNNAMLRRFLDTFGFDYEFAS